MFHALRHHKLNGDLVRPAEHIEDLLTSVVIGACSYVEPGDGIIPFLSRAAGFDGPPLHEVLRADEIVAVDYSFWPYWNPLSIFGVHVDGGEPDVVVTIRWRGGERGLLVIEAKLGSGKSSEPSPFPRVVTDQLAKYALQLVERANAVDAMALGVIYLTTGFSRPSGDLANSAREAYDKTGVRLPLFWLSWREFTGVCSDARKPALLRDAGALVAERWALTPVPERWAWEPIALANSEWSHRFPWPNEAPVRQSWSFRGEETTP